MPLFNPPVPSLASPNSWLQPQTGPLRDYGGALYNVRGALTGVVGDGVADDRAALNTLAGIAANGVLLFPTGTYLIGSDLTLPANVALAFGNGAKLSIPNGVTVTISGALDAGLTQIFACTGTGKVVLGKVVDFYPEWWGAVGNGIADDWAPLQAAIVAHKGIVNGSAGTYQARGRVLLSAATYLVSQSLSVRSVYGFRMEAAGGKLSSLILGSGIPAAQPGVTQTGGYILRLEGVYQPTFNHIYARGDGVCGGVKLDGLPAPARPTQAITPVAGAGTPANFVGGTTYYIWMTYVTGANGETQASTSVGTYVMPGSPNPIQINIATILQSFGGVRQARFYISTTNDSTTGRYVGQSTLDSISTGTNTNMLTILDPTPIAHPVTGSSNQPPPTVALTGGLVSTQGTFEGLVVEGPLGATAHALHIGSDRWQADQMSYHRCKFDGQAAKNTSDLVFIEDSNAVLHHFVDCLFGSSGAKGIAVGGSGGSFNLKGCGFIANTDWDIETSASTSRGTTLEACWAEGSTRFCHVGGGTSSLMTVTALNCSVNGFSDSQQRIFAVDGCSTLLIIGGKYQSLQGGALTSKIVLAAGTSRYARLGLFGAIFDGNPISSTNAGFFDVFQGQPTYAVINDGSIPFPIDGIMPRGTPAAPVLYSTNLNFHGAAWLKIASGTVLAAGVNSFTGASSRCKGSTNVTVDSVSAWGGITTQAPHISAVDAGASAYTIRVLLATGFTLTSDLVFRVSFHPEPQSL